MKQSDILKQSEADTWLERNRDRLGDRDPVSDLIADMGLQPKSVLEIGCSNGWRLAKLRDTYGCQVVGVEPGAQAVAEATKNKVPAWCATADALPLPDAAYDLVICGFFIYFADPVDYLKIAAEADRVLQDGGFLIIFDFVSARPFKRRYAHHEGIFSYHFDPPNLWLGHPGYRRIADGFIARNSECVTLLRKDMANAFPLAVIA